MKLQLQYTRSALVDIYVSFLDGYDNELLSNQIINIGDQQNRLTNVKADMTRWKNFLPDWKILSKDIVENHLVKLDGDMETSWVVHSLWGVNYHKGDYTILHNHCPSTFSFVYYVKASEGSSPLVFSDIGYELLPKENDLIIFPSHLNHGVPSQTNDAERIVISGNISAIGNIEIVSNK